MQDLVRKILKEGESYQKSRSLERQKKCGEVFTPTSLVLEMFSKLGEEAWEEGKTYCDPSAGNGQFLAAALLMKIGLGHDRLGALRAIYGVELLPDNVEVCKKRLHKIVCEGVNDVMFHESAWKIVDRNIVCADGLTYDYKFNDATQ